MSNEFEKDEKREKDGRGLFYGIIGVATLVVAIIGATYAYFTATATNDNVIQGTAAVTGVDLAVEKISNEPNTGLVPMLDSDIAKGLVGTAGNACVDENGNAACQLYKVTVTNRGDAATALSSTLSLVPTPESEDIFTNLKWAEITSDSDATLIGTANLLTVTDWKTNYTIEGNQVKDFYLLLWISETGSDQSDIDKGSYTGTITFNTASGTGVTATFSN